MVETLPDLFPGFESHFVETAQGPIFCRTGGTGPALLLVHGYPQSHVIWHKIAAGLAKSFTLVMPDLPGYGQSVIPPLSADHAAYSKRTMAQTMVEVMSHLGHEQFGAVGHDRGGRVVYRMALDMPDRISSAAVLDILPTFDYWNHLDRTFALKIYHWAFLAQPAPFPENMIAADPIPFLEHKLASWSAAKDLSPFSEGALQHTRAWFSDPVRIAASCEDYRAGAHIDYDHDAEDRRANRTINPPFLALWGEQGIAASIEDPLAIWQTWCPHAKGKAIKGGHFLPEESPKEITQEILEFFSM
ncbi:alpha/beta fold hydrolase [Roseibium alexandrii]